MARAKKYGVDADPETAKRVIARLYSDCKKQLTVPHQPGWVTELKGILTLGNSRGVIARYRISKSGRLFRIKD